MSVGKLWGEELTEGVGVYVGLNSFPQVFSMSSPSHHQKKLKACGGCSGGAKRLLLTSSGLHNLLLASYAAIKAVTMRRLTTSVPCQTLICTQLDFFVVVFFFF